MRPDWRLYLGDQPDDQWAIPYNEPVLVKFDNGRYGVAHFMATNNWFDHIEQKEIDVDGDHPFVIAWVPWSECEAILGMDESVYVAQRDRFEGTP